MTTKERNEKIKEITSNANGTVITLNNVKKELKQQPFRIAFLFENKTASLNIDENDDVSAIVKVLNDIADKQIIEVDALAKKEIASLPAAVDPAPIAIETKP